MKKVINNPRIIIGVLSELEHSSTEACVVDLENSEKDKLFTYISLSFGQHFADAYVELSKTFNAPKIRLEIVKAGRVIFFELEKSNYDNKYLIPNEIFIDDLRTEGRLNFDGDFYLVELKYPQGNSLGYLFDLNSSHYSILIPNLKSELTVGVKCDLLVRERNNSSETIFSKVKVLNIINYTHKLDKVILKISPGKNQEYKARPKRKIAKGASIEIIPFEFGGISYSGKIKLVDVSLTGFKGELSLSGELPPLPTGMVFHCVTPDISFSLIRKDREKYCFEVMEAENSKDSLNWHRYINEFISPEYREIVDIPELKKLFTEGSLVKMDRRQMYGNNISHFLMETGAITSDDFIRRLIRKDENNKAVQHVSAIRLSDATWLLQEGVSLSSSYQIKNLYLELINRLKDSYTFLKKGPRYVTLIYSPKIKKNYDFCHSLGSKKGQYIFHAYHKPIATLEVPREQVTKLKIKSVSNLNAEEKIRLSEGFPAISLVLCDFFNSGYDNPILRQILSRRGKAHYTSLEIVLDSNGNSDFLVYYSRTHYSLNVTGVYNTAFVFIKEKFNEEVLVNIKRFFADLNDKYLGCTDIQIVSNNSIPAKLVDGLNEFEWSILDFQTYEKE